MINVIAVEGCVASGKTTALDHVEQCNFPGVVVVREPVDDWRTASLLEAMYDGSLPMCTFQVVALTTRVAALRNAMIANPPPTTVVVERSVFTDRLFAMANLDSMSASSAAYDLAWKTVVPLLPPHNITHIMLQCPTAELMTRIASRGRQEELQVTSEYLETINELHNAWASAKAGSVTVVDACRSATSVAASTADIILRVLNS